MKYINAFEKEEGITAFFSTKEGAVKGSPYDNEEVFAELGLQNAVKVWPVQVHSDRVVVIDEGDAASATGSITVPHTDGVITNVRNVLLTTVHADCLPVYFYDEKKQVIGLVHSGWRGTVAGIVPQAMRKMTSVFGVSPETVKIHIGPGISSCCFEVGTEVAKQFLLDWGYVFAEETEAEGETKYLLDLKATIKKQLTDMGIQEENIETSSHCTCCEPERFCSYRREGGTEMRMGAGICMK
ncbi:MAG: peptidoglycan editing factor PgeF [Lentihominibacter sp.]|jgi:YfiH family protein